MSPVTPPKPSPPSPILARSPYTLKHVPSEIVLRILEAAYDPHDLPSTHRVLMSSALVNRDWSILAQKLLFRHVTLRSQAAYHSLLDALSPRTPRSQMLAGAVMHLRVIIDHNQPNGVTPPAFAQVVALCPRLQELDLSLFGRGAPGDDVVGSPAQARMQRMAPSFDAAVLDTLCTGSSIRRLRFANWTDNSSSLSQLLHIWPSLKALEIIGTPPTIPPHASAAFPCSLQDIRVNCQRAPSLEFLKWLLQTSNGSLRKVRADRESCVDVLARVVRDHHETVASAVFPVCPSRETTASLMDCQDLQELCLEDARVPLVLCKTLPSTLQRVALGIHRDTDMQPLLRLIHADAGLSSVSLYLWKGGEGNIHLETARIACALQGVQLNVVNDIRELRSQMVSAALCPYVNTPR